MKKSKKEIMEKSQKEIMEKSKKEKKEMDFKFALGQQVFVIGQHGLRIVEGRGHMEFLSDGKMNYYFVGGARADFVKEYLLVDATHVKMADVQISRGPN